MTTRPRGPSPSSSAALTHPHPGDPRPRCVHCPECDLEGRRGYCAPRACYCGHPSCYAVESYRPVRRLTLIPNTPARPTVSAPMTPGGSAWDDREEPTWLDRM